MADQETKIRLTAVDDTAAAINSATARFNRMHADMRKQYRLTEQGALINIGAAQKAATRTGKSLDDVMKGIAANISRPGSASRRQRRRPRRTSVSALGGTTSAATHRRRRRCRGSCSGSRRHVGASLLQSRPPRRSFVGYAELDTQLRHTQIRTKATTADIKGLKEELRGIGQMTGENVPVPAEGVGGAAHLRQSHRSRPAKSLARWRWPTGA